VADLDPHYAYSSRASLIFLAMYEMLIQYKGSATDDYDPMLAVSWQGNEDNSSFTFSLAPGATFHDGSPCDAQAVKDSFTRYILMGAAVADVLKRFVTDPEQMVVVDPTTIRFDLGRPQPLFLAAMASEYGPFVVNPRVIEAIRPRKTPTRTNG
jgi:peptide/nickel transport system substrate-binding protein